MDIQTKIAQLEADLATAKAQAAKGYRSKQVLFSNIDPSFIADGYCTVVYDIDDTIAAIIIKPTVLKAFIKGLP